MTHARYFLSAPMGEPFLFPWVSLQENNSKRKPACGRAATGGDFSPLIRENHALRQPQKHPRFQSSLKTHHPSHLSEPIDGGAADERGELPATHTEALPHRTHSQHDVQVVTHTLDEGRVAGILCTGVGVKGSSVSKVVAWTRDPAQQQQLQTM